MSKVPISLRTIAGELLYQEARAEGSLIPLKDEPRIKEWQYWFLIVNRFPPTIAYKTAHLLLPKRIFKERSEMSFAEAHELDKILRQLQDSYDQLTMNFAKSRSVKDHFHYHLLEYYDERSLMKSC